MKRPVARGELDKTMPPAPMAVGPASRQLPATGEDSRPTAKPQELLRTTLQAHRAASRRRVGTSYPYSAVAPGAIADGSNPFTISHTAMTISCANIGMNMIV